MSILIVKYILKIESQLQKFVHMLLINRAAASELYKEADDRLTQSNLNKKGELTIGATLLPCIADRPLPRVYLTTD